MKIDRLFLFVAAIGLIPVALSYGSNPAGLLPKLYGFDVVGINEPHIFRAVMGLYLGQSVFWIAGALKRSLRIPALWSLMVFMFGIAAGRLFSIALDGVPHWALVLFLVLELVMGAFALSLIRRANTHKGSDVRHALS